MPNTPINISFANGQWQANPSSATVSKAGGVTFNVAASPGKTGVLICFSNSNVFGVTSLQYASGRYSPTITGSVGQSSTYHLQDYGSTCTPGITGTDPFAIDIGSSEEL